jgi:hypothetical protein
LSLKNVGAKRAPLPASKGVVVLTEWLLPSKSDQGNRAATCLPSFQLLSFPVVFPHCKAANGTSVIYQSDTVRLLTQ